MRNTLPGARPKKRGRQLGLLVGISSMDNTEMSVTSVMFPALRAALGLPLAALGVLVAVSKLVGVVTGPLWVLVAQRYSRRTVLAACSGLWGVWTIATGFVQNYPQLIVMSVIAAAGVAGGGPLVNAILSDLYDDASRGRAAGYLYGFIALFTAVVGPLMGQLSRFEDGWRYGFFAGGTLQICFGVLILLFLRDPGVGASEPGLAPGSDSKAPGAAPLTWRRFRELLRIRTFVLVLVQRLTTGQFILLSFGVVFLTEVHGYSNAEASLVVLPMALAFFVGTLVGGVVTDRVHRRHPDAGRIAVFQTALIAWALLAWVATQVAWGSITLFAVFFSLLTFISGFNPGVNRPLVSSVTPPELRGAAYALMLSAESVGWALSTVGVGYLGDLVGLKTAFLWLLVLMTLANGLFISLFYRPYVRDTAAVRAELARRSGASTPSADQERTTASGRALIKE
ncbi:MFS transporter [Kitasatospora sp. NPDC057500]|uniref:MFS transporter n=1 Tax=Kitasatospora sp. NPDC057500 TaxID=3346151 RepID=UPI0036A1221D